MRHESFHDRSAACQGALRTLAPMHLEGRVSGLSGLMVDIDGLGGCNAFIWLSWVAPYVVCEVALQWRAGAKRSFNRSKGR